MTNIPNWALLPTNDCFLTLYKKSEKGTCFKFFNRDKCCHLALCLWSIRIEIRAMIYFQQTENHKRKLSCSAGIVFNFATKNITQHIVINLVFMRIPKWGLPFLYLLHF